MAGKFEIYKDKGGKFRFRLKAANGETILASQGYKSKSGCKNGIASVQKNCTDSDCYKRSETSNGKFRFNLCSRNSQVVGTSETYNTASARDNGIASVRKNAPGAKIADLTT